MRCLSQLPAAVYETAAATHAHRLPVATYQPLSTYQLPVYRRGRPSSASAPVRSAALPNQLRPSSAPRASGREGVRGGALDEPAATRGAVVRAMETAAAEDGQITAYDGEIAAEDDEIDAMGLEELRELAKMQRRELMSPLAPSQPASFEAGREGGPLPQRSAETDGGERRGRGTSGGGGEGRKAVEPYLTMLRMGFSREEVLNP